VDAPGRVLLHGEEATVRLITVAISLRRAAAERLRRASCHAFPSVNLERGGAGIGGAPSLHVIMKLMARAIGSASISFGLVNIPVKLYSTTQAAGTPSFNLLHKACGSRLRQQYFCIKEEVPVKREDMVKGYEFAKDQYVTFTPEELKELEEKGDQTVAIEEFVPIAAVDPIYYEKAYYLGPEKGGEKAYRLLARVMTDSGRCAVARYAARGKSYLVLVRPVGERLVLQQLHHAEEIRPIAEVPIADADLKDPEVKLARQLVDQIAHETFDAKIYEDEVGKRVQEQIDRKIEGQQIATSPTVAPQAQIIDIMEALKASLAKQAPAEAKGRRGPQRVVEEAKPEKKKSKKG
jgi:DNA end-binding protein Ku